MLVNRYLVTFLMPARVLTVNTSRIVDSLLVSGIEKLPPIQSYGVFSL
jgi:hypothetical protein